MHASPILHFVDQIKALAEVTSTATKKITYRHLSIIYQFLFVAYLRYAWFGAVVIDCMEASKILLIVDEVYRG